MPNCFSFPTGKETRIIGVITLAFYLLTGTFVGLRAEHFLITFPLLILFFLNKETRKLVVALIPFVIFAMSYDWMRVFPNYMVNPIDVKDLYDAEMSLFGVNSEGIRMIPCEYFVQHPNRTADLLSGIFYLTWVPVPIVFGIWLYLKRDKNLYLRFAMVFLLVNLLGFAVYYIHPAAPPWYVMNYGFEPVVDTPGNAAGLVRFDQLAGVEIFDFIYGRNSNVFAALPSLHAAYMLIALFYAVVRKSHVVVITILSVLCVGIWWTAVYSGHHYIIDVLLGIICTLLGIFIFEVILMSLGCFRRFINRYSAYIS